MAPTPNNGSDPPGLETAGVSSVSRQPLTGSGQRADSQRTKIVSERQACPPERSKGPIRFAPVGTSAEEREGTCPSERSEEPAFRAASAQYSQSVLDAAWSKLPPDYRIPDLAPTLQEARAYCERLATSHYENFSVATWFLPRRLRPHFHSVYAYCRISDDLGDEVGDPQQSLALLDVWQSELDATYATLGLGEANVETAEGPVSQVREGDAGKAHAAPLETRSSKLESPFGPRHPVFIALRETIIACDVPKQPFADLLQAFRQDQGVHRYETFNDVLGYCRYSADPVGRMVRFQSGRI